MEVEAYWNSFLLHMLIPMGKWLHRWSRIYVLRPALSVVLTINSLFLGPVPRYALLLCIIINEWGRQRVKKRENHCYYNLSVFCMFKYCDGGRYMNVLSLIDCLNPRGIKTKARHFISLRCSSKQNTHPCRSNTHFFLGFPFERTNVSK